MIIGATDSMLYVLGHDGTDRTGFPFACGGKVEGTAAVGDPDGDGELEIAAACSDRGLVWLLERDGTVAEGWPQTVAAQSTGGVSLVDVTGDGVEGGGGGATCERHGVSIP